MGILRWINRPAAQNARGAQLSREPDTHGPRNRGRHSPRFPASLVVAHDLRTDGLDHGLRQCLSRTFISHREYLLKHAPCPGKADGGAPRPITSRTPWRYAMSKFDSRAPEFDGLHTCLDTMRSASVTV